MWKTIKSLWAKPHPVDKSDEPSDVLDVKAIEIGKLLAPIVPKSVEGAEAQIKIGTGKVWVAYRCMQLIAEAVAAIPPSIRIKGGKEPVRAPGLEELLKVPNQYQTWNDLSIMSIMHLVLTGIAYLYKSEANQKGDRPRELINIPPQSVKTYGANDGGIKGYGVMVNGREVPFDVTELIVLRRQNPLDFLRGLGPVQGASEVASDILASQDTKKRFFENGAAPGGLMVLKNDFNGTVQEWDELRRKFHQKYAGKANQGRWAFMQGEWEFYRLGLTPAEASEIESSKWNVEQLALAFGVPLSVLGLRDSANYATAEVERQRFMTDTVLPILVNWRDTLQTDLVDGFSDRWQLHFDLSGTIPIGRVVETLGPMFDRGAISLNELRERAGFARIEEPQFDQHFIQSNYVPIELAGLNSQLPAVAVDARRAIPRERAMTE